MRVAIQTDTRQVVSWTNESIGSIAVTRRDKFPVELKFIEGATFVALPAGATGRLSLKVPGDYAGIPRVVADSWVVSGQGRNTVYTFLVDLNTAELATLFQGEPASVALALEIEWVYDANGLNGIRQTSVVVPIQVANDYIRDTDGLPVAALDLKATQAEAEAGVSNEKWMTPLRTKQAITVETADLSNRIDLLAENLDTESLDSIAEAAASINGLNDALSAETQSRAAADSALSDRIEAEANSLNSLQEQVDGKVSNYTDPDLGEQANVAPAAIVLRDAEEPQFVALRHDGREDGTWTVRSPGEFRTAIGAASQDGLNDTNTEFDLRATGIENRLDTIEEVELPALGQRIDLLAENLDTESLDSIAEAAASIGALNITAAARYQLPVPEVVFQRWGDAEPDLETRLPVSPLQLFNGIATPTQGIILRNNSFTGQLPLVRAHGLPAELLASRRLFLEFVILRGKKNYVPSAHFADGSWPLPWPRNSRARSGEHRNSEGMPFPIDRPNHIEITAPSQTLPAWRCLNGRLMPKTIEYATTSGEMLITAPVPTFTPTGGQWKNHRAYDSKYTLLKFAYRFLIWDPSANAGWGEHITGPLTRPLILRHHIWPFLLDHHASSIAREPRCTLAPDFNPYLMTCDFAQ